MKHFALILLLFSFVLPAPAVLIGTNALTLTNLVSTTANGTGFQVVNVVMPARVFLIQHSGITGQVNSVSGTNSIKVNVQWSTDAANWTTLYTYTPRTTNSTVDTFAPDLTQLTLYLRAQAVTTNTVTIGVTAIKP